MSKLFNIDIQVFATAYIVADSAEEAQAIANGLAESMGEIPTGYFGDDIEIFGGSFHADMPELSLSPAMTIGAAIGNVELVEDFDEEEEGVE